MTLPPPLPRRSSPPRLPRSVESHEPNRAPPTAIMIAGSAVVVILITLAITSLFVVYSARTTANTQGDQSTNSNATTEPTSEDDEEDLKPEDSTGPENDISADGVDPASTTSTGLHGEPKEKSAESTPPGPDDSREAKTPPPNDDPLDTASELSSTDVQDEDAPNGSDLSTDALDSLLDTPSEPKSAKLATHFTSNQRVGDLVAEPLLIFARIHLPDDLAPINRQFKLTSLDGAQTTRFSMTSRSFPDAWSRMRACWLDLTQYPTESYLLAASITETDIEIVFDQATSELHAKALWRKAPASIVDQCWPGLGGLSAEYTQKKAAAKSQLTKLLALKATDEGKEFRTQILSTLQLPANELVDKGQEKIDQLERYRVSLPIFAEKIFAFTETGILQCNYNINMAAQLPRIFYPPVGYLPGSWESLDSWQSRVSAAKRPHAQRLANMVSLRASAPNDLEQLDLTLDNEIQRTHDLLRELEQFANSGNCVITIPYELSWFAENGTTVTVPLVIDCELNL